MDLDKIIKGLSSSGAVSGFAGGLAGTAVAGALAGKKGRKMARSALNVGALAAVGGLAYTAYQRYRQGGPRARSQSPALGLPDESRWQTLSQEGFEAALDRQQDGGQPGMLLVRAMIAAANADGHLDAAEQRRIFGEVSRMDLTAEDKARLFEELHRPMRLNQLVAAVQDQESAVEVYAASLIAIDETTPDGESYLRALAAALSIPEALVNAIHEQAEAASQEEGQDAALEAGAAATRPSVFSYAERTG
jgi:uncharacterized membrane protein YebE (DUF533 family)